MSKRKAMQIFEGLMLGDAGLSRTGKLARFYMALSAGDPDQWRNTQWSGRNSKIPQMQYLVHIIDCLKPLGVRFSKGYPTATVCLDQNGKSFLRCGLSSLSSVFLLAQFERWYHPVTDEIRKTRWFASNRKWYKILPIDIELAPLTIAVWFEGDGNTEGSLGLQVKLTIATNSFTKKEVERLGGLFLPFGVQAKVCQYPTKKQMTWALCVGAIDSVNTFFSLTEEHIHSCYRYKIRRAKHASECSTEEEKEGLRKHNKYQREYKREQYWKRREKLTPPDPFFTNLRLSLWGNTGNKERINMERRVP